MSYTLSNTNQHPYYDDYDADKNFFRVLFNPARAVQARELTQIQTILQNQISSFGNHIFQDGSGVLNGEITTKKNKYITITNGETVELGTVSVIDPVLLIGRHIRGNTSNSLAKIMAVDVGDTVTSLHLMVRGGEWEAGEYFQTENYGDEILVAHYESLSSGNGGSGVIDIKNSLQAYINTGIIYVAGFFIIVTETQNRNIFVESNDFTAGDEYKIGFRLAENVTTFLTDDTLEEPANGTNRGAIGADRFNLSLELMSYKTSGLNSVEAPDDFFTVLHIQVDPDDVTKIITLKYQSKSEYADIENWLARRTYDESGSYTVKPYSASTKEISLTDNDFKYQLSSGKSYVYGHEHELFSPTKITASKGRTSIRSVDEIIQMNFSSYVTVDTSLSLPSDLVGEVHGLFNPLTPFSVELHNEEYANINAYSKLTDAKVIFVSKSGSEYKIFLISDKNLKGLLQETKSIKTTDDSIYFDRCKFHVNQSFLKNSTIVELPNSPVKSTSTISYIAEHTITSKSITNGNQFTLNVTGSNQFITGEGIASFFGIINETTGVWYDLYSGTTVFDDTAQQITIDTDHGLPTGTYSFVVKIERFNVSARTKELRVETDVVFSTDINGEYKFSSEGFYDILDIDYIKLNDGSEIEHTDKGVLDNGQRDDFYDYGTIRGLDASTEYKITLYRFFHNTNGDFFSVLSYDTIYNNAVTYYDTRGGAYAFISIYVNESKTHTFSLRSCIDFRRNVTELTGTRYMALPADFVNITYDYYLPRKDKIWINKDGYFGVTEGIAHENPKNPPDKSDTLTLFDVYVPAYVFLADDVHIKLINTKNYTMNEIHKLENRIANMEYYSSLNNLRLDSETLNITDASGLPRNKNGIMIDPFNDHTNGETLNSWYRCSMDYDLGILRCPYDMENIAINYEDGGSNIKIHENTITLDYNVVDLFKQAQSSENININPYDVFVWAGEIILNPLSDFWVDVDRLPDLQVDQPELSRSIQELYENINVGQPRWSDWETSIIGVDVYNETVRGHGKQPDGTSNERFWSEWLINQDRMLNPRQNRLFVGEVQKVTSTTYQTTRTGTITELSGTRTITKEMGDRVVDVSQIRWMRSINLDFIAEALKPDTELKIFYADEDITLSDCYYYDNTTSKYRKITGVAPHILKTDSTGKAMGRFIVPEETFKTGTSVFTLIDREVEPNTTASTEFTANGLLQKKQKSILSVEVPTFTTREIRDQTRFKEEDREFVKYYDPIAESFLIEERGGVFLKEIDIFFQTKDNHIPVTLQIVEVDTGYPTQRVLPFSRVIKAATDITATYIDSNDDLIKYSQKHFEADGTTIIHDKNVVVSGSPTDFIPTSFTFSDPVFLKEGVEYAFVLLSNSNNYEVYISNMGDYDLISGDRIVKQPFMGVMFKSQNASTWTADQNRDIKFTMKKCEFSTSVLGNCELRGEIISDPWDTLTDYVYVDETVDADKQLVAYQGVYYELIADANNLSEIPPDNPTSWLKTVDSEHETTLVNISVEDMILPDTDMTYNYILNTGNTPKDFVNKTNINLTQKYNVSTVNETIKLERPVVSVTSMSTINANITPVINRNRSSMILVNNLVLPIADSESLYHNYTGDALNIVFDAGKYISKITNLKEPATDLRVLLDTYQRNSNVDVSVKFRSTNANKRYLKIYNGMPIQIPYYEALRDAILYVYHFDDPLNEDGGSISGWTQKSNVIIDGFGLAYDENNVEYEAVYVSSIGDYNDFVFTGTNPRIFITSEPDIDSAEIEEYSIKIYTSGDYVLYNYELYAYTGAGVSNAPTPSKDATDWDFIEGIYITNDSGVNVYFPDWQDMRQVTTIPKDFDIESDFIEREFIPAITPSESFDTYSIMIEMWSDTEITVPLVKRLRSIAVE